jgi:hypothetical protein
VAAGDSLHVRCLGSYNRLSLQKVLLLLNSWWKGGSWDRRACVHDGRISDETAVIF